MLIWRRQYVIGRFRFEYVSYHSRGRAGLSTPGHRSYRHFSAASARRRHHSLIRISIFHMDAASRAFWLYGVSLELFNYDGVIILRTAPYQGVQCHYLPPQFTATYDTLSLYRWAHFRMIFGMRHIEDVGHFACHIPAGKYWLIHILCALPMVVDWRIRHFGWRCDDAFHFAHAVWC